MRLRMLLVLLSHSTSLLTLCFFPSVHWRYWYCRCVIVPERNRPDCPGGRRDSHAGQTCRTREGTHRYGRNRSTYVTDTRGLWVKFVQPVHLTGAACQCGRKTHNKTRRNQGDRENGTEEWNKRKGIGDL